MESQQHNRLCSYVPEIRNLPEVSTSHIISKFDRVRTGENTGPQETRESQLMDSTF